MHILPQTELQVLQIFMMRFTEEVTHQLTLLHVMTDLHFMICFRIITSIMMLMDGIIQMEQMII